MADSSTEDLVLLYLAGKLDGEDAARVKALLETSEWQRGALAGLREALQCEELRSGAPEIQVSLRVFRDRLLRTDAGLSALTAKQENSGAPKNAAPSALKGLHGNGSSGWSLWTLRSMVGFACAAASVVAVGALTAHRIHSGVETTRTYATHAGQQAVITLLDGTRATLAPRTTMRLSHFGFASRTVELDGQAYFEVAHASDVPFRVRTGAITTQVLGTSFLVRHYANDKAVHVAVIEGKVRIASAGATHDSPVTLTAGHVGDITDSTVIVNTDDHLIRETEWRQGRLVFRHAPVIEVLQTLSHWYGYHFHCGDSTLMTQSVTLSLDAHSSAAALSRLEQILDVRLTFVGDTVTLTPHTIHTQGTSRSHAYDLWIPTREVGR